MLTCISRSLGLDVCVFSVESGVDVAVPGCRIVGTACAIA